MVPLFVLFERVRPREYISADLASYREALRSLPFGPPVRLKSLDLLKLQMRLPHLDGARISIVTQCEVRSQCVDVPFHVIKFAETHVTVGGRALNASVDSPVGSLVFAFQCLPEVHHGVWVRRDEPLAERYENRGCAAIVPEFGMVYAFESPTSDLTVVRIRRWLLRQGGISLMLTTRREDR